MPASTQHFFDGLNIDAIVKTLPARPGKGG
jgi:hypothetical protein